MSHIFKEKLQKCKTCNNSLSSHFSINDETAKPKAGDFSVCLKCGELSQFSENFDLEPIPPDILEDLLIKQPETFYELMKIRKAVYQLMHAKRMFHDSIIIDGKGCRTCKYVFSFSKEIKMTDNKYTCADCSTVYYDGSCK